MYRLFKTFGKIPKRKEEKNISSLKDSNHTFKQLQMSKPTLKLKQLIQKLNFNKEDLQISKPPLKRMKQLIKKLNFNKEDHEWLEDFYSDLEKSFSFDTIKKYKKIMGSKKYARLLKEIYKNYLFKKEDERKKMLEIKKTVEVKQMKRLTIMIIGISGVGKSSLINLFYLWSLGLNDLSDIKNVLIPTKYFKGTGENNELNVSDQGKSQTQKCSIYNFSLEFGNTRYYLNFVDTPGLGDVQGIKKDDEHIENILETISKTPEINCILLMLNGTEPRLNDRIIYSMTKLMGILPDIVQKNLFFLLSNVKYEPLLNVNKLMSEITKRSFPCNKILYYDNAIFQLDLKNKPTETIQKINCDYQGMKEKLAVFLKKAGKMKIHNNEIFAELKMKRYNFTNVCILIQKEIEENRGLTNIHNLIVELKEKTQIVKTLCSDFNYEKELELSLNILKKRKETQIDKETETLYKSIRMYEKQLEVIFNKRILLCSIE